MRFLLLAAALLALPVEADMYRWIDRETGSVKFSNTPPPWFGDPEKERQSPRVEVIKYRGPAEKPKPGPAPQGAGPEARTLATLEARWLELARFFASLPPGADLERANASIRQQAQAYQALSAELDRLDPGGTARRRSQEAALIESVRRGVEPTFFPRPPTE